MTLTCGLSFSILPGRVGPEGGLVVIALAFNSDPLTSNLAEVYSILVELGIGK